MLHCKRENRALKISNRRLYARILHLESKIKDRNRAIRIYARTAKACKPIIIDAIESKIQKDRSASSSRYRMILPDDVIKDAAQQEYDRHFGVAEVDISDSEPGAPEVTLGEHAHPV